MQEEIIFSKTKQGESLIPALHINIRDQKAQQKIDFVNRERGKRGKDKKTTTPPQIPKLKKGVADVNIQSCFSRARFLPKSRRGCIPSSLLSTLTSLVKAVTK